MWTCLGIKVWVDNGLDIVRKVRPIVRHLIDHHPPSAVPDSLIKKRGGGPESAFQGLKATFSPGSRLLYSHWHRGVSPISRFAANRDPDSRSRPNRETGVPDSRFRPSRESGIPFPVSRPNRESGERELGISGSACEYRFSKYRSSRYRRSEIWPQPIVRLRVLFSPL